MKLSHLLTAAAFLFLLTACDREKKQAQEGTDKSDYSYAIGAQIGKNLKQTNVEIDSKSLIKGFKDALKGDSKMSDQEIMMAVGSFSRAVNMKAQETAMENLKTGMDFLEKNKTEKDVVVTETGLQYKVIKEGQGSSPKATDRVKVNYRGTLIDGTEFDSSYARNQPVEFALNEVIPGWTELLQKMKPGATYKAFIPSNLAYGPNPQNKIPGNSVLVFDIELLEILR